jgi:site-specific recombinase XerD
MNTAIEEPRRPLFGGKSPSAIPWHPLPYMDEYVQEMELDEDITPAYIASARVGLAHFALFCEQEGIKHPNELERMHILRFQAYLTTLTKERDGQPFALSYRQQLMKYVQRFVRWLLDVEHIQEDPWIRIKIGSVPKKPKPLEDDEVAALFEAHRRQAFTIAPFTFHRREIILVILFGWGLRINELASLGVAQMDMRQDFVTVRNKGKAGRTKRMPYDTEIKQVVQRWLILRGSKAVPEVDSLLIDQQGQPLSIHMIRKIVTDLGVSAGVDVNPHRFRDTLATTLLNDDENPVPVERVKELLGHSRLSQTLAYSRVGEKQTAESHSTVIQPLLKKLLGGQLPT